MPQFSESSPVTDNTAVELRKFVAPEFVFGHGAMALAGRYARNFGARNVLLVTDPGVESAGWVETVRASLDESGVPGVIYNRVSPNPRDEEVMAGAEFYRENGCDVIVAVGGGSPMDCAKGIGIVSTNQRHILEFEGVDVVDIPGPPLICVPTTAGTSADVSQFAIVTNTQKRVKIAILSKTVIPDVALIDPAATLTMDSYLTACTGIDALVHAIEAFLSTASSPITDLHALEAIRLVHGNLLPTLSRPDDVQLRSLMMRGSLEAGLAFSNASLGAVHAMAHSLGGRLDLPHGECNAILLPHVMAFNAPGVDARFDAIGAAMGLDSRGMATPEKRGRILGAINSLKRRAGILVGLGERGVKKGDIPQLAINAMADPCMVTNPRRPNRRDIEVIYEESL